MQLSAGARKAKTNVTMNTVNVAPRSPAKITERAEFATRTPGFALAVQKFSAAFPGLKSPLPLIWGKCQGNKDPKLDLANLLDYSFQTKVGKDDKCMGLIGTDKILNYKNLATVLGLSEVNLPNFLKIDLNKLAVKNAAVKIGSKSSKTKTEAVVQMIIPPMHINIGFFPFALCFPAAGSLLLVEKRSVGLGLEDCIASASTNLHIRLCGTGVLKGLETIRLPFCLEGAAKALHA